MYCWVLSFQQNALNICDVRFIPASEIIFLGGPNSANVILAACTRPSVDRLATFLQLEIYCNNLQNIEGFYY